MTLQTRSLPYALLLAMLAAGCTAQSPGATNAVTMPVANAPSAPLAGLINIQVSSGLVSPFDPTKDRYEIKSLSTLGNVRVRVTTSSDSTASIGGVVLPSGQWTSLPVTVLDKGTAIPINVTSPTGVAHTYQLATLPADFPDYTVQANNPDRGLICMTANALDGKSPTYIFVTDELGHPIFYKKTPGQAYNLQRFVAPDGTARYSYLQVEGPQLSSGGTFRGSIRLLDGSFKPIKSISLLPTADHPSLPAELHDFVYLNDNDYIVEAYEQKNVNNIPSMPGSTSSVLASVVQEVVTGGLSSTGIRASIRSFMATRRITTTTRIPHILTPTICT